MSQRSLKIALNTRVLLKDKMDGIGWFTFQVVKRWVEKYPQHQFFFLFDRDYDESFIFGENVTPIVVSPPARHAILWYIWYEFAVPKVLKKINPDVFVSLDTYTSIAWKGKKITGIHDIAFALFDGHLNSISQWFLRKFTPQYIVSSDKIVTVSHTTKNDLISNYNCNEDKIIISHNAPSEVYKPRNEAEINLFKNKNTNGNDFFLFVGSVHPRKNVIGLLKSFESFKSKYNTNHKLVIIGRFSWKYKEESAYLEQMKFKSDIVLLPHSTPDQISKWMASAVSLVLVSNYEGFGVPIVEAMACGVPIICSNISSMPEVAGKAAILVNPNNYEEISTAMYTMISDENLRKELILNGADQVKKYNWNTASEIVWKEIESLTNA